RAGRGARRGRGVALGDRQRAAALPGVAGVGVRDGGRRRVRMDTMTDVLNRSLAETDPEVAAAIGDELHRQQNTLEMIASENFAPVSVLSAQGSVLTNKYAEGYPGRRYYGGCEYVDVIERLAIERVKALFGAGFANVQPHSGAQANAAAMFATLTPGDTILGLDL